MKRIRSKNETVVTSSCVVCHTVAALLNPIIRFGFGINAKMMRYFNIM